MIGTVGVRARFAHPLVESTSALLVVTGTGTLACRVNANRKSKLISPPSNELISVRTNVLTNVLAGRVKQ